jgi:two-component system response regulator AtoC
MTRAVEILAISDDVEVCNIIVESLELRGKKAICVPSPQAAMQLLNEGVRAHFFLFDVVKNKPRDEIFLPELMQQLDRERLCILAEIGDVSWESHAAKWNIGTNLFKPLLRQDLEDLTLLDNVMSATKTPPVPGTSAEVQPYHLEELDNNRFFLAASPAMLQIYRDIRILAPVDIPILILGESGVGKEIVAMLLHKYHVRSESRFLNVNCAALPSDLLESELFGYEAGAFTGATKAKPGKFELADKGTMLLDEIGEMSRQMQAKLLHVLQDGSFFRLGAQFPTQVDVRVLAATNINMQAAIAEKRFREDLYYRLNTLTITVPPLRERREEIPLLIEQLVERGAKELPQSSPFSAQLIEAAQEYHWPGNLRELRNFVTRTLILRDQKAAYEDLRSRTRSSSATLPEKTTAKCPPAKPANAGMKNVLNEVKVQTEIQMLRDALSASGWNRRRAASNLNISYRSLLYKIQQYGLSA